MPTVWPIPTPTAMGTAPATAETWEAMTYASALITGTTAEMTPKPIEVSNATSSGQPQEDTGRPYRTPDMRSGLLHQRSEMMQPGDL